MSPSLGTPPQDSSTSKDNKGSTSTRKAPPSPLAISTSISPQSRLQPPSISTNVSPAASSSNTPSSSSNAGRNSLDSSRSDDLTSVRSELTSLRVSEFPLPPSALPTIPASPRTPRSLQFSTTPRSQSPNTSFAHQQQQSPASPVPSERVGAASPVTAPTHGYDMSRDPGPARYSQYAVYKESNNGASASRPATPTTAGTTTRDWSTSSERPSSLQPPRPAFAPDIPPFRSSSPLRNTPFASQQDQQKQSRNSVDSRSHSPAPHSPRSPSPQPPRSPLPVPPRTRDSTRYSHIARKAGVTDMGLDINEEDLLSTEFISEMLNQPAAVVSSPRSARFSRLPDSPQSGSFTNAATDNSRGLSAIVGSNDIRLAPGQLTPGSPGFSAPKSVSASDMGLPSPTKYSVDTPGVQITGMDTAGFSPADGADWQRRTTRRMQSGLASSIFPSGGDRIDQTSPSISSFPKSPNVQPLTAPDNRVRSHLNPHPLMPSTPLSPESFTSATSPRSPEGYGQVKNPPAGNWRNTSQSLATHLPIGGRPSSSISQGAISPRIRQHRYPRYGGAKKDATLMVQNQSSTPLQSMTYPPHPVNHVQASTATTDDVQDTSLVDGALVQPPGDVESPIAVSFSSSTRTQRDSMPVSSRTAGTIAVSNGSSENTIEENPRDTTTHPRDSFQSSYPSTDHGDDDAASYEVEGEIQTASRVLTTSPSMRTEARPTIIGIVPAVFLNQNSEHRDAGSTTNLYPGDMGRRNYENFVEATPPASPRDPPSIHSPPAHRTDMPESVKSLGMTEDVHGVKNSEDLHYEEVSYRLPYDEVAYGYHSPILNSRSPNDQTVRNPSGQGTSFKSVVSYITTKSRASISKVSNKSTYSSRWAWLRRKPLPPLPPGEESHGYPDAMHHHEAGLSQRAGNLPVKLDQGSYARSSKASAPRTGEPQGWSDYSTPEKAGMNWYEEPPIAGGPPGLAYSNSGGKVEMLAEDSLKVTRNSKNKVRRSAGPADYVSKDFNMLSNHEGGRRKFSARTMLHRPKAKKWLLFLLVIIAFVGIILGVSLGTTIGRKHGSDATTTSCSGDTAGARCNLDATCICPSPQPGTCSAPLAKALAQLIPVASQLFVTNISTTAMAIVLWETQGTPIGPNCASQANLVDVGSFLDSTALPNRTQWAQAALLWSLFQTGDVSATQEMQAAMKKLPFQNLQGDGPQADASNTFVVSSSPGGYIFNFATQTVDAPPLKFRNDASPSSTQLEELNSIAQSSLDRMYSFASASSTQRQTALSTYWESELSLDRNDLPTFVSAFKNSPVLLPFDATASPGGKSISDLLRAATNRTLSFPPPIGCFPGLSASQLQRISTVESQVFGLSSLSSSPSDFDSSCFANRPVYGILDVLRTRLPFSDSRVGVAKQAAILAPDATSRVVVRVGELLSALPAANTTQLTSFSLNPREFGTLSHVNHIALAWLQAFPTTTSAADAAKFVLSSPSSPPLSSSSLFNSTSIPVVETAVFGNIFLSDITSFTSSFSTPSGALFFGSSQGDAFRHWVLQQSSKAFVTWSSTNFGSQAVREETLSDSNFEGVWSDAASLISSAPGGVTSPNDVAQITAKFPP